MPGLAVLFYYDTPSAFYIIILDKHLLFTPFDIYKSLKQTVLVKVGETAV